MKKLIAVMAVIALLCGILPLSAFAASIPVQKIVTDFNIGIDEPMAGREADFYVYPSNGIRAFVEQKLYQNYYHGVRWHDLTDDRYLAEGDCFELGHDYRVTVYVISQNPFYYTFGSYVTVTVNNESSAFSKHNSQEGLVNHTFYSCPEPPADIDEVTIGGSLVPVDGQTPVFDIAFDEERLSRNVYTGTAFINNVAWYNSDTFYIMDQNDSFEAGNRYTMSVILGAKGNYRFATENGKSAVKATINGFQAENISHEGNEDESRYLKLKYTFTCLPADSIGGGCDDVFVQIASPAGGNTMSFYPTLTGENCELRDITNEAKGFYNGVKWYNRTTGFVCPSGAKFRAGEDYSVSVLVTAQSILQDETRLCYVDNGDGTYTSYLLAYVNGLPARVEPYEDVSVGQTVQVIFDFPACNDTSRTIDDITLTDIRKPVCEDYPDTEATVIYNYIENIDDTHFTTDLFWIEMDENGMPNKIMGESDLFSAGCTYVAVAALEVDSLTDFLVDEIDNRYGGSVSMRGAEEIHTEWGNVRGKRLSIMGLYTPLSESPDPIESVDIIGLIPPTVGQRPCESVTLAEKQLPFAEIASVKWYENGALMVGDAVFTAGNRYDAFITVSPIDPYAFATEADLVTADVTVTVNGESDAVSYNGNYYQIDIWKEFGTLTATTPSGVTDYVEIGEIMRPAPGQTPDFNADINSAYTQFGGITWCELDDDDNVVNVLSYDDLFKVNKRYRVEVRVLPTAGRTINLDSRGAMLNDDIASYYYLPGEAVTVYAVYDTANCVTDINIMDVQYPIPGKTPDTDGRVAGHAYNCATVTGVEWSFENTGGAGFSTLDGKFKADRRHQAYVRVETKDGCWLATDKNGDLAVNAYVDGIAVDFSYTTDSNINDGALNSFETARTYERAQTVDGVFIDGMWLQNGQYLDSAHWGLRTEETVDKDAGYAYYYDGVLTLHNFNWFTRSDYNIIDSYKPLTIKAEGASTLDSSSNGIVTNDTLTLEGDGSLNLYSNGEGIFAMGDVTVESGTWYVMDDKYDGLYLYSRLTMNGGTLDVYGPQCGINGDDYPTVSLNGGTLIASAAIDCAIGWCNTQIANGATVMVNNTPESEGATEWDGVTDFIDYAYVCVAFEDELPDMLLGDVNLDGKVDLNDATALFYYVNGLMELNGDSFIAGDINEDGKVDLNDATLLFYFVNGLSEL